MTENFANAPQSIGEIRAEKNDDAGDWTVRDCLISLLRDIDNGKLKATSCIIAYQREDDKVCYSRADKTFAHSILLLESVKQYMISDWLK